MPANSLKDSLLPGDLVEVLSEREILATLDEKGTYENLPFMPEMLKFCGQKFRVSRQAFKTCVDDGDMRQLEDTIFLEEARCDGAAHGGCNRACLIFWKAAWVKKAGAVAAKNGHLVPKVTSADLAALATRDGQFFCQSSEILNASKPLPWWRPHQYLWDLKYNRLPPLLVMRSLLIAVYNKFAYVLKFNSWKFVAGDAQEKAQLEPLNLKPGELVRVKSVSQIRQTLDRDGKHQNLLFAPAMAEFSGKIMRVQERVERIILEGTTKQRKLKDTVLLEGATCDGVCHRLCPRQSMLFWRESWLERVSDGRVEA